MKLIQFAITAGAPGRVSKDDGDIRQMPFYDRSLTCSDGCAPRLSTYGPSKLAKSRKSIFIALLIALSLITGLFTTRNVEAGMAPNAPDPYVGAGASGLHELKPAHLNTISLPANTNQNVVVSGRGGIPATGVDTVSLAVTISGAHSAGQLFIWPTNGQEPSQPSAVFGVTPTTVHVLTKIRAKSFEVRTTTDAIVRLDVTGWYDRFTFLDYDPSSALHYHSVAPTRLRSGVVANNSSIVVQVAGRSSIPDPARARVAAVYLTTTAPTGSQGFVTAGGARVLSFGGGRTTSFALLRLNSTGGLALTLRGSDADLAVDVSGYYGPTDGGIVTGQSTFIPRVALYRRNLTGTRIRNVIAAGKGRIPDVGAESVFVLVSVTNATGPGSVVFHGAGLGEPETSAVKYKKGSSVSLAVAELDFQSGALRFTKRGSTATIDIRAIGWNAFVIPPPPDVTEPPPGGLDAFVTPSSTAEAAQTSAPYRPDRPAGLLAPTRLGPVSPDHTIIRQDPVAAVAAWTDADLASAVPMPLPARSAANTFHDPFLEYPIYESFKSDYLPSANYDPRIGRIYFRNDLGDLQGFCTATVVARNLVITAAHCITDFINQPTSLVFVAGQQGENFHSVWGVSVVDYYTYFAANEFYPLDFAVMVISPNDAGAYVGDVVGWHGIYGAYAVGPIYQVGYPSEGWWVLNGRCGDLFCDAYYQWSAQADYYSPADGWWEQAFGGYVNGGASGGPIFQYLTGYGWLLTSVVSHGDNTLVWCEDAGVSCDSRYYGRNTWVAVFNNYVLDLYYTYAIN